MAAVDFCSTYICAYYFYRVKVIDKSCIRKSYDYDINEYVFEHEKYTHSTTVDGKELMNMLMKNMKDDDLMEITTKDNKIHFGYFNEMSGETFDIDYIITELKRTVFDDLKKHKTNKNK